MLKTCPNILENLYSPNIHHTVSPCKGLEGKEQDLMSWYATESSIVLDND